MMSHRLISLPFGFCTQLSTYRVVVQWYSATLTATSWVTQVYHCLQNPCWTRVPEVRGGVPLSRTQPSRFRTLRRKFILSGKSTPTRELSRRSPDSVPDLPEAMSATLSERDKLTFANQQGKSQSISTNGEKRS